METLEILTKARELLSDPANWTKGSFARIGEKPIDNWRKEEATCFCSVGACLRVSNMQHYWYHDAWENCLNLATMQIFGGTSIVGLNDHPNTTHEDIMKVFDKAIELAKE